MERILIAVLFVFALGGCTTVGKLAQVVGGAYTGAGQVLIDKGEEDKREEQGEKARAAAKEKAPQEEKEKQGVPVQADESDEKPAKKPLKKNKKG